MQLKVLEMIHDIGEPEPKNASYEVFTRMRSVGFDLIKRGYVNLLGHNHPDLIAGRRGQWYLTSLGKSVMASGRHAK